MNNSLIVSIVTKLYAFLCNCYEYSAFKKICVAFVQRLKKITENSFFVNFFSSAADKNLACGSKICSFFNKILTFFRSVFSKVAAHVKRSTIIQFFGRFYGDILYYPIRYWGITVITSVAVYSVFSLIWGGMTSTMSVFAVVVLIVAALCCAIDTSIYNLFTGSVIVKLFGKLLGSCEFEKKDTKEFTISGAIICTVSGLLIAVASLVTNPIYAIIFVGGTVAMGWILYDYTVGIFIAAVVLAFSPTMSLVGLIMFTFASFVLRFVFDENMTFKRTPLDIPMLLFACVLLISAVTSFAVKSSIMAVLVYLAFILSYFLLTNSITTKRRLFALIVLMLFVGLFVAAYGIYQHIFGFAGGTVWTDTDMFSDIETRVVSTFENPNVLGEYLLLLIPIGLAVVWGAKKGYNKLIHLAIVGALSLCMIYTYSRGNWIGLLVAVFMFFMFYDRRFVWLGVVALLLSPMFLPQNVINRFLSVGDMGDTSTSYRVYIWMGTLNMLKDYWFSGIGVGTEAFNKIYPMYAYSGVIAPHSHNLYLQIITENGIVGLLVFLSMLVIYFKMCVSTIITAKNKFLKALITGFAAGMLGYLVQGMFDNVWYNYRVFLLFFVIIGITAASIEICKSNLTEVEKC